MLKRIDPFMALMLGITFAAIFWPAPGPVLQHLEDLSTLAVSLLFLFHGAVVSPGEIGRGLVQWRLHSFIFAVTFLVFPVLTLSATLLPPSLAPEGLVIGFVYLGVLPSAVSSSIAFTAMARGNVPGAICSAAASNLFGLLLSPLLLSSLLSVSSTGAINLGEVLRKIILELLLPFATGQAVRPLAIAWVNAHKRRLEIYDQTVIILVIYAAFSGSADLLKEAPPAQLLGAMAACLVLLTLVLMLTMTGARILRFPREDEVAAVFCGSKKSLASGLPLAQVIFAGAPGFGMIILPILIYNQAQIFVGALLAKRYAALAPTKPDR